MTTKRINLEQLTHRIEKLIVRVHDLPAPTREDRQQLRKYVSIYNHITHHNYNPKIIYDGERQ